MGVQVRVRVSVRYSRKAPGKGLTVQFSMIQIWLQTALMSETLCVITWLGLGLGLGSGSGLG